MPKGATLEQNREFGKFVQKINHIIRNSSHDIKSNFLRWKKYISRYYDTFEFVLTEYTERDVLYEIGFISFREYNKQDILITSGFMN